MQGRRAREEAQRPITVEAPRVDQLEHVEQTSQRMGHDFLDLSLLTDGLRAEREQGITIDVAYRYFATAQRRFIIADTPGHGQYTRNMVTGASTADLAIVLIDARKGVVAQSKRHAFIASLLRIPHILVCVNKMDLVDFDEGVFDQQDVAESEHQMATLDSHAPAAVAVAGAPRRHGLVHGPAGRGQVHDCGCRRGAPGERRVPCLPA